MTVNGQQQQQQQQAPQGYWMQAQQGGAQYFYPQRGAVQVIQMVGGGAPWQQQQPAYMQQQQQQRVEPVQQQQTSQEDSFDSNLELLELLDFDVNSFQQQQQQEEAGAASQQQQQVFVQQPPAVSVHKDRAVAAATTSSYCTPQPSSDSESVAEDSGVKQEPKAPLKASDMSSKKRKHAAVESDESTYRHMIEASLSGNKRSIQFCSVCFCVRRRDGELVDGHKSDGYCPVKKHRATADEKRELRRVRQKLRRSINRKIKECVKGQQPQPQLVAAPVVAQIQMHPAYQPVVRPMMKQFHPQMCHFQQPYPGVQADWNRCNEVALF